MGRAKTRENVAASRSSRKSIDRARLAGAAFCRIRTAVPREPFDLAACFLPQHPEKSFHVVTVRRCRIGGGSEGRRDAFASHKRTYRQNRLGAHCKIVAADRRAHDRRTDEWQAFDLP